ncbi:hypothetical protein RvY_13603 [Ramazzottius varieornatus]|uniref:G-protein coupled receptors family 1 profile domain-containing protein n=1 Tax=Ramazzottius varieornatus TaxID=947166 RepID=A0A1D1VTP0_RAMVA|nr:hypothetical protein RvY_13603 [Ramazzottius varieornatus]
MIPNIFLVSALTNLVNASLSNLNNSRFFEARNSTSASSSHPIKPDWYLAPLVTLTALTILSNFLIILSFCVDRHVRTSVFNYYLLNIAIWDFIVGIIPLPYYTIYYYQETWLLSSWQCSFFMYFDYTASATSLWGLVVVSINRMLAVTFPIFYRHYHSKRACFLAIAASWLVVNASTLPGFIYSRYYFSNQSAECQWDREGLPNWASSLYTSVVTNGWLPSAIAVFCYCVTVSKLFHAKVQDRPLPGNDAPAGSGHSRRSRKERQAFLVLTLLLAAMIIFFLPWYVYSVRKILMGKEDPAAFDDAAVWMTYALSAVNPFLFNAANNDIKHALSSKLCGRANRIGGTHSVGTDNRRKPTVPT